MFDKKILLPHQYYYPHMDLFEDKSTVKKEEKFSKIYEHFYNVKISGANYTE